MCTGIGTLVRYELTVRERVVRGPAVRGSTACGRGLHSFTLELNLSNSRSHS